MLSFDMFQSTTSLRTLHLLLHQDSLFQSQPQCLQRQRPLHKHHLLVTLPVFRGVTARVRCRARSCRRRLNALIHRVLLLVSTTIWTCNAASVVVLCIAARAVSNRTGRYTVWNAKQPRVISRTGSGLPVLNNSRTGTNARQCTALISCQVRTWDVLGRSPFVQAVGMLRQLYDFASSSFFNCFFFSFFFLK